MLPASASALEDLLDHVEQRLLACPDERPETTGCAYIGGGDGEIERVEFPQPRTDSDRQAVAAILLRATLSAGHGCVLVNTGGGNTLVMDGHHLAAEGVLSTRREIDVAASCGQVGREVPGA